LLSDFHEIRVFFTFVEKLATMTIKFVYWQEGDFWLGYLEEYPDYMSQGKTLDELKVNLADIYHELVSGTIPNVRKVGELELT
jgi:predicted RNase H-like HicB family nuclease